MQFLFPTFLWALLALAIPIIIHLFHFRRFKKVYFTNVRFLKEIKDETSSRNKLKNLLILLSRCLALASLVFAFAQPFLSKDNKIEKGTKAISIFVDNSASMAAEDSNVPLLEIAKSRAIDIVNAYEENDQFQILTHDFEGKHQRLVNKEEALSMIEDIKPSAEVKTLSRVFQRQKQVLNKDNNTSYILSDFQKSITDLSTINDTTIEVNLLPLQATEEKNVSIDSAWFETPVPIINANNKMLVKVTNHSDQVAEKVKISFAKDGQEKPISIRDIGARSSLIDTVNVSVLKPGIHQGIIKVADFPIQFDDEMFVSFKVEEEIKVLAIHQGSSNRYVNALFQGISYFKLNNQSLNQIQFQQFAAHNLILLSDISTITSGLANELRQYVENGGKLLIFPPVNADLNNYNSFLGQIGVGGLGSMTKAPRDVAKINTDEFIFADVYEGLRTNLKMPKTTQNYSLASSLRANGETLLTYRDETPFLAKFQREKGFVYLCAAPLSNDYNDLVLNAEVFVPMLYKMALASATPTTLSYFIGRDNVIPLPNQVLGADKVLTIKGVEEFIPGQTQYGKSLLIDVNNQIKKAGFYQVEKDGSAIASLAFNYDRKESDLSLSTTTDLEDQTKLMNASIISSESQEQLGNVVVQQDRGIPLWKWFVLATLLFLLAETILIRLFKN